MQFDFSTIKDVIGLLENSLSIIAIVVGFISLFITLKKKSTPTTAPKKIEHSSTKSDAVPGNPPNPKPLYLHGEPYFARDYERLNYERERQIRNFEKNLAKSRALI